MNELERATTALVDRPVAPPAPLERIERRAGTIRRRRRLIEGGAIALVVLVLGTAGFALATARDDDQGVFVGEGPATSAAVEPPGGPTTWLICLDAPTSEQTLADVTDVYRARLAALGRTVTVSTVAPGDEAAGGCASGQGVLVASDYPQYAPDWVEDQIAMLRPGLMRSTVDGSVLHPEAARRIVSDDPDIAGPALEITLPEDEHHRLQDQAATTGCPLANPCWLAFTIDDADYGPVVRDGSASADGRTIVVKVPELLQSQLTQLAALLAHPLPDGVSVEP